MFELTVLGSRGSIPVSGMEFAMFGGETSCYMLEIDHYVIFFDAGSGIMNAPEIRDDKEVIILLSHPHIDHLIGLPFYREIANTKRKITVYGRNTMNKATDEQLKGLFDKPYWPITPWELSKRFECYDPEFPITLTVTDSNGKDEDCVVIDALDVYHPGGCLAYKISFQGKTVAYMTDCEIAQTDNEVLSEFVYSSDLLLCDAQYTSEEYKQRQGFGHSTPEMAIELFKKSKSRKLLLIHHDPRHTDSFLSEVEKRINNRDIQFARTGMIIEV